ncbi:RHS repeat-associated core domain-containing protein [Bacteroides intestinalis]|uniref:RHS repeat-associated core domain-containing protein n=4 Tax=Bacteroides TaxID=816 RepID=A0AAQ0LRD2_9BACE|nr:RHS repeat-associated core domain-containing protein [Bacteroides intestinalis]RGT50102.1 RHS repeat-associated core domain-containing protein [Bacteroides intestinalis]
MFFCRYDGLNRLTDAYFSGWAYDPNFPAGNFAEHVTAYDKNSHILGLSRYGQTGAGSFGLIDSLTYSLQGNRIMRVDDAATASVYGGGFEFQDAVKQDNEYVYDANGNLTKDLNKGIVGIQYNYLNLPNKVTFGDGSTITYTYAADGTKLRTLHKVGSTTTTTDYCGSVIYENGVRKYLLTEEGYVSLSDGIYHYFYRDHLGNVRLVMGTPTSSGGQVEERNDYYPFGGLIADLGSVQPYKYNGKELDTKKGLNWYDYGARQYDAALGIFTTVDPSSEKYYPTSPYVYCGGDPINRIDPTGADWYKDSDGNYHWAERGDNITEGWTWVGSSVSIEISKSKYVNYYENGGIVANKPVNAFDLIASSPKLQNLFLGENSLLSEASKSRLFNGLVNRSLNSIGIPVGQALVGYAAVEFGGIPLGKIFGWGAKGLVNLLGKSGAKAATQTGVNTLTASEYLRIENAATRINMPINVVGSRASGTATAYSDWDYIIEGINKHNWNKIKNSLPGARSILDNTPRNIDLIKEPLDRTKPFITIYPR